jgi:hypothetical protein
MRRKCGGLAVVALFVVGCHRDGGEIGQVRFPNVSGRFVIEDDDRTVALTSVQHSIYYVVGAERKLVFHGAGGRLPVLSMLGPDDILLQYCGGSIYTIESSFFDNEADDAHGLRILRLQPVTSPGLKANGRSIC